MIDELGDAVSPPDDDRFAGRIEQPDDDFTAVVSVNDADPLGDGQSFDRAETAAGIDKSCSRGLVYFGHGFHRYA